MIDNIASLYKSPDEVDLYMAGMSERVTSNGGILGHTFSHIIADQFARLKEGDRFFYELGGQPSSFTIGNALLFKPSHCFINVQFIFLEI